MNTILFRIFFLSFLFFSLFTFTNLVEASYTEGQREISRGNFKSAFNKFLEGASKGDPKAQNALGELYLKGKGTSKNPKKALIWFKFAANAGNKKAYKNLSFMYAKGIGVDKKRIGERVTINTSSSCGNCKNCIDWTISRCENAERSTPFFSEFSFAPNQNAIKIPDDLDLEIACMTEPASCCLSGVKMLSNLENSRALVIGGGIMGQFCAGFLKTHGAKEVIMSEPIKSRREISKDMNVDILHDPKESNLEEFIDDLTDSKGIDIAIEAVGKPELVDKCIKISKPGGQVLMIGVNPAKSNLKTDLYEMHYREITLKGAFGRGNVFHQTPKALQKLKLTNMISKRYPLNQVKKAIYDSSLGKGIKLVVKP